MQLSRTAQQPAPVYRSVELSALALYNSHMTAERRASGGSRLGPGAQAPQILPSPPIFRVITVHSCLILDNWTQ